MPEENIANLFEKKEELHLSGTCICFGCKHEWSERCPIGTTELECPECHTMKGRMKYEVVRSEDHWMCNCGNTFFSITLTCIYCPNCGVKQKPYD